MTISRASIPRELRGSKKRIKTSTIGKGKKIVSKKKPGRKKV
tara:strand:- start:293 stop:418 length:126 start_codon:yes stop_codon:yes gene_type:complete